MNSMARAARGGIIAVLSALLMAACGTDVERDDDTGELLEPTEIDVFELRVGDCLDGFSEGDEISRVRAVPCSADHSDEVFAAAEMSGEDYPGDDAVADFADEACVMEFEQFVGTAWEESELDYGYLVPTESSWAEGDREVLCIIGDPESDVTGSLENAGR